MPRVATADPIAGSMLPTQPAVAGRPVVTIEEIRGSGEQPWHLNNTALKNIRAQAESPAGWPNCRRFPLFDMDPLPIRKVIRTRGPTFTLDGPVCEWSWRKMLNGLKKPELEQLVGTHGVQDIWLGYRPGSYDRKRTDIAKKVWSGVRMGRAATGVGLLRTPW